MRVVLWLSLGLLVLYGFSVGCTSEDIFHDTHWKTICDQDANTPGCDAGVDAADGGMSHD